MPAKACQGSLFNMYFARDILGPTLKETVLHTVHFVLFQHNYRQETPILQQKPTLVSVLFLVCLFVLGCCFFFGPVLFNAHHCPRSNRLFSSDYETGDPPLPQYSLILVSLSLFPMLLMA